MGIDINTLKISIGRVDCLLLNIFISNGQAQQHHPKRTSPQALARQNGDSLRLTSRQDKEIPEEN